MTVAAPVRSVLDRCRAHRAWVTWLFVGLLCLVATERRLAELHFNLRLAGLGFENDDALDGDEIRIRLVALNDEQPPALPPSGLALERDTLAAPTAACARRALGLPSPRGPPALGVASA